MSRIYTVPEDIEIIAGDTVPIPYEAYLEDGGEIDFNIPGVTIEWSLSLFEYRNFPIFQKTNEEDGGIEVDSEVPYRFIVTLSSADTSNLSGIYLYQVEVGTPSGTKTRRVEGSLIVAQKNS